MPGFEFEVIDARGATRTGRLEAASLPAARTRLERRGDVVVRLEPATGAAARSATTAPRGVRKVGRRQLALLTRQLATLVSVAPLEEALSTLAAQAEDRAARALLLAAQEGVREGQRLSDALDRLPGAVPATYRAVVAAGESSGRLAEVLGRLAGLLEAQEEMGAKVSAALIYPLILAVVAVAVISGLMVFVVPRVVEQFTLSGRELPALTQAVIAVSRFLASWGWLLAVVIAGGAVLFSQLLRREAFRTGIDGTLLRLPLVGRLIRDAEAAGFARTLATMVSGGLPVLEALQLTAQGLSNRALRAATRATALAVREGSGVATALKRTGVFPPLLIYFTQNGEGAGRLDPMLTAAAEYLEREFRTTTSVLLSLLEPAIIVLMGLFVGLIVLAIMLPILQINTLAGR